jgi:hypothetical protein
VTHTEILLFVFNMKRKRSSVQHLSDQDTIQRAVLPVATRLTNPNGPPVTGDEYLKLVRQVNIVR